MQQLGLSGLAVVTGAGQGIGREIAVQLLRAGASVMAAGRTESKLKTLTDEADIGGGRMTVAALDIQDSAAIGAALTRAEAAHGPVRYLVNAAGVLTPARLLDTPEDMLRETVAINMIATIVISQIVARRMVAQKAGSIITIGSNSGTTARAGLGAYAASKAGVAHAMKCLGLELAPHGVRCNIVSPGSTDTPMQSSYQGDASSRERVLRGDPETFRLGIPTGRMADPADVAAMVLFLLSDRARQITMENIVIDGGATLGAR